MGFVAAGKTEGERGAAKAGRYLFKRADDPAELRQLHRLNYLTFVRELPQHADPGRPALIDKFHDKNTYVIAKCGERVVGMVAVHDTPPFSVAEKLPPGFDLQALGPRPLEVRLLAVERIHRNTTVLAGLGHAVLRHAERLGHSHLLISGVTGQQRMYRRMGFRELGPPVRRGDVEFVPMVAFVARMPPRIAEDAARFDRRLTPVSDGGSNGRTAAWHAGPAVRLLTPGTAQPSPAVAAALARPVLPHRGPLVTETYARVRHGLSDLVGGARTGIFCGTGTLANEVVAATLAADRRARPGLVLVNGEFGRRLAGQAERAGLRHRVLAWDWGRPWDLGAVAEALQDDRSLGWVWAVHLESSTGMLNDVSALQAVAGARGVEVCLDAVSSLGAVPLDLSCVRLATGVANKSLGGVAGLAFVFAAPDALLHVDAGRLPAYLDLPAALERPGPRFTVPSPVLLALDAALAAYADGPARRARFEHYAHMGRLVRRGLRTLGLAPVVDGAGASPVITSFEVTAGLDPDAILHRLRADGLHLGGDSDYLRGRRWLQLATLGDVGTSDLERALTRLGAALAGNRPPVPTLTPPPARPPRPRGSS